MKVLSFLSTALDFFRHIKAWFTARKQRQVQEAKELAAEISQQQQTSYDRLLVQEAEIDARVQRQQANDHPDAVVADLNAFFNRVQSRQDHDH